MKVKFFDEVEQFAATAAPHLEAHEAENNLLLGIISAIRSGQYAQHPPLLSTIEDADQVIAVAIRTPPHNLVVSFDSPAEATTALAAALRNRGEALPGVNADVTTAAAFTEAWADLGAPRLQLAVSERIYRLETVQPPAHVPGRIRIATEEDVALVTQWFQGFAADTGEVVVDPAANARSFIPARAGTRALMLWEVDDQPVSMAGYAGPTPRGIRISAVYTPPDLRGRGYASACVATLSQYLLDRGRRFCFLFTDLANPTSNHIYQQIGYEPVCDVSEYRTPANV